LFLKICCQETTCFLHGISCVAVIPLLFVSLNSIRFQVNLIPSKCNVLSQILLKINV